MPQRPTLMSTARDGGRPSTISRPKPACACCTAAATPSTPPSPRRSSKACVNPHMHTFGGELSALALHRRTSAGVRGERQHEGAARRDHRVVPRPRIAADPDGRRARRRPARRAARAADDARALRHAELRRRRRAGARARRGRLSDAPGAPRPGAGASARRLLARRQRRALPDARGRRRPRSIFPSGALPDVGERWCGTPTSPAPSAA